MGNMTREQSKNLDPKIGEVFIAWTVIDHGFTKEGRRYVPCQCSCGKKHDVLRQHLISGNSKRCKRCHWDSLKGPDSK
jgi:hypothetical protein